MSLKTSLVSIRKTRDFRGGPACHGLCSDWKRISRHRAFQKGLCLLRAESRDNEGAGYPRGDVVRAVGRLKGEPMLFVGL